MTVYSATFAAVGATAAQDVFEIVAPAHKSVRIREVRVGQYTDFGDAAAEIISIQIIRGYTTAGSGGSALVPNSVGASSKAYSTLARNNTTVAQDGTAQVMLADVFNVQAGWWYRPPDDERIQIEGGQRLVVRITAPADSITLNGTIVFEEIP